MEEDGNRIWEFQNKVSDLSFYGSGNNENSIVMKKSLGLKSTEIIEWLYVEAEGAQEIRQSLYELTG